MQRRNDQKHAALRDSYAFMPRTSMCDRTQEARTTSKSNKNTQHTWCCKPVACFGPCHRKRPPQVNVWGAVIVARCFLLKSLAACIEGIDAYNKNTEEDSNRISPLRLQEQYLRLQSGCTHPHPCMRAVCLCWKFTQCTPNCTVPIPHLCFHVMGTLEFRTVPFVHLGAALRLLAIIVIGSPPSLPLLCSPWSLGPSLLLLLLVAHKALCPSSPRLCANPSPPLSLVACWACVHPPRDGRQPKRAVLALQRLPATALLLGVKDGGGGEQDRARVGGCTGWLPTD